MYTFEQALEMIEEQTVCTISHPIGGSKISKEANHSFLLQRFNALIDGFMKGKYNIQIIFSLYEGLSKEDYKTFCIHHSHMKESLEILRKGTGSEEEKKDAINLVRCQLKYLRPLYISGILQINFITNNGTSSTEEKKDVIDLIPSQFKYSKPLYTTKKTIFI